MLFGKMREILGGAAENFFAEALLAGKSDFKTSIWEALSETGAWHKRDCPLKAPLVVWLVLFLALHRDDSIPNVFRRLVSLMREKGLDLALKPITPEALHHARGRMGVEPIKRLFEKGRENFTPWCKAFHGHRLLGIDGVYFRVPDSLSNAIFFGRRKGRKASAYPQLLAVALVEACTHRVRDVRFQACHDPERDGVKEIIASQAGTGDLILMDRGISAFEVFSLCKSVDARFIARIPGSWKPIVLLRQGEGDYLVMHKPCTHEQTKIRAAGRDPKASLLLRMVTYTVGEGEVIRILTDLTDAKRFPAKEIARLYYQRWEAELAFDELKTHFATVSQGKQHTHFRSKSPEGVLQEAYAMMTAYNLIRDLMVRAALHKRLEPLQLSFVDCTRVIELWSPTFARNPDPPEKLINNFLRDLAACKLRPRQKRRCPRKVKIKMTSYHVKRKSDVEEKVDLSALLTVVEGEQRYANS